MESPTHDPRAAIVVPCTDITDALHFYCDEHGFRVERISPAEAPRLAIVVGYGLRLQLDCDHQGPAPTIHIETTHLAENEPSSFSGPDGTMLHRIASPSLKLPPLQSQLEIARFTDAEWVTGRAGMRYRDLIAKRQGGRFIASHIHIPHGGPVPDYVHYHAVRFQMIYCYRGWVRVVYEDQGEPFVLRAGDCVLQPPMIRHQVLESSEDLEVIELGSPALHDTYGDLQLQLPNSKGDTSRQWQGQQFVRHQVELANWEPSTRAGWEGWEYRDSEIAKATAGLASVVVNRYSPQRSHHNHTNPKLDQDELLFMFILCGELVLTCPAEHKLSAKDAITIPQGASYCFSAVAPGSEVLEIRVGASPLSRV